MRRENNKLIFLLIHPEISRTRYNFVGIIENECLELEYIQTMLQEQGHQVFLYDGQIETIGVPKALHKYAPDVVYVCGRTRQEKFMLEYCRDAKKYNKNIITMIGGLHAQLSYKRMEKEEVDYIFTSFNIFQILEVLSWEYFDKERKEIEGLCQQVDGIWKETAAEPFDINRLPRPDRSYFYAHEDRYRYLELEHAAWVRTAYSCPYCCEFCVRNHMNCGVYSTRDIEDVVDEIAEIRTENIYIVDDDFLFDEERLERFISLIRERGIRKKFICYGRADFIASHAGIMKKLKAIGFYYVLVGLEATNNEFLQDYNKKAQFDSNLKSIEICHILGIHMMGLFILDLRFKPKDFNNLFCFVKKQDLKHVAVSIYTPEFGLSSYEKYKDRMITDDPSHFDYLHLVAKPIHMSVKNFYIHYYILMIKLFARAKKDGIYDFIDYGEYIRSLLKNLFRMKGDKERRVRTNE